MDKHPKDEKTYITEVLEAASAGKTEQQLDTVIRAHLDSWGYEDKDVTEWRKENYSMLRQAAYPDIKIWLDAQVKLKRGIYGEGAKQEDSYLDSCWAVKERFPKK